MTRGFCCGQNNKDHIFCARLAVHNGTGQGRIWRNGRIWFGVLSKQQWMHRVREDGKSVLWRCSRMAVRSSAKCKHKNGDKCGRHLHAYVRAPIRLLLKQKSATMTWDFDWLKIMGIYSSRGNGVRRATILWTNSIVRSDRTCPMGLMFHEART